MELDSFVTKLKNLWNLGISATLNVEVDGGKASIVIKADLGYLQPPLNNNSRQVSRSHRGPAYRRRQERRRNVYNVELNAGTANSPTPATEDVNEVAEEVTTVSSRDGTQGGTEAHTPTPDIIENRGDRSEVEIELRHKIMELENEIQQKK